MRGPQALRLPPFPVPMAVLRRGLILILIAAVVSLGLCLLDDHDGDVDLCFALLAGRVSRGLAAIVLLRSTAVVGALALRLPLLPRRSPVPPI